MPNPTFCISTSTSPYPLTSNVAGVGVVALTDDNNNPYYATTTCPNSTTTVEQILTVDNPSQNVYNGLILFCAFFFFVVWYFLARFKLK